jgi:ABC-type polysaccharide/polyol phosphate export permease
MFNSLDMLPGTMQSIVQWNPFFYFNDGLRYAMTNIHEASLVTGGLIISGLLVALFMLVLTLFKRGWRLRV